MIATDETFERRGAQVLSSIGSIPEPIEGIPMKGELFDFSDWDFGRLERYPNVFSAGNVVTGKGNIVASRKHAKHVSKKAIEAYLGVADPGIEAPPTLANEHAGQVAAAVADHLVDENACSDAQREKLEARVRARQAAVGFPGDVKAWLDQVGTPC